MTPDLDSWLQQATRSLSKDSVAQVRTEIQKHYQSARDDAISGGASQDEANRMAPPSATRRSQTCSIVVFC
jgi:hypothetical protein